MTDNTEYIYSRFWEEVPQEDNPFTAAQCFCSGYDVYGELIEKAGWVDYLYLLFLGEKPSAQQSQLLNSLAVALANPGPREYSVQAAMCAGAGGSTMASSLIAALAVGAGNLGGSREVFHCVDLWQNCGTDLSLWEQHLTTYQTPRQQVDIWQPFEHPPGFDPNGISCPKPVQQTLTHLASLAPASNLAWLKENRTALEAITNVPLSFSGVAACALHDLTFEAEPAEMIYLLLRLPGAAAHSLEQRELGWKKFPFYPAGLDLTNAPLNDKDRLHYDNKNNAPPGRI